MNALLLADSHGGLTLLDHAVIGVYLAAVLAMGLRIARRQRSTEDFFVAGRNLPAWAVGISLFASLLSTITYLGMPGEMFRTGVAFLTRQLPIPVVLAVVWFLWIPFFMRLKLTSAYEYLQKRFSYPVRALAAVFCLCLLFGWMSVVVLTASKAMVEIANLDLPWFFGTNTPAADGQPAHRDADMHLMILSIGVFSVLYTTLGGIRAVVWTDVIQFFVLMAGAFFTMGAVAHLTGSGPADWLATSQAYKHEKVEWFNADIGDRSNVAFIALGMCFWFVCTHGANQVALQRYFTVKNVWAARRSYLVSAVASALIGVILAGVGISLMHFIQHHELSSEFARVASAIDSPSAAVRNESMDAVFPQFIRHHLDYGLRGLLVAALFAAAMSTIDSGANSTSTIVTVDFVRPFETGEPTPAGELRRARAFTAAMGVIIVGGTVLIYHLSKGTDIITLCQKGFNCFLGPLGGLFCLALFSRRATSLSVIPAVLLGEAFGVGSSYSEELLDARFSTHLVVFGSWLVTIVSGLFISLLLGTRADDEQARWMWKPVVCGKPRSGDSA